MFDRQSIRFRIAVIVALAVFISLGGFALFLHAEIRGVNERDETAKLKNTNELLLNMIAQTDAILRQQVDSWSHSFTATLAGNYTLEAGETPILKLNGVTLNSNTNYVDGFSQASNGNVATIFVRKGDDFVRISTSLKRRMAVVPRGRYWASSTLPTPSSSRAKASLARPRYLVVTT